MNIAACHGGASARYLNRTELFNRGAITKLALLVVSPCPERAIALARETEIVAGRY
ncbi:hypothetical protein HUU62_01645 [Rhodoferax sp. 4810]|nr:hypothetical protein [Rhodoferax jenense]